MPDLTPLQIELLRLAEKAKYQANDAFTNKDSECEFYFKGKADAFTEAAFAAKPEAPRPVTPQIKGASVMTIEDIKDPGDPAPLRMNWDATGESPDPYWSES